MKLVKSNLVTIDKDVFECADFWLLKGQAIHAKLASGKTFHITGQDTNIVALDYYLSGVKTDPKHFGCVYNVACSFFMESKFLNALKWFKLALKLKVDSGDSMFGKAITCLKLGKLNDALQTIQYLI